LEVLLKYIESKIEKDFVKNFSIGFVMSLGGDVAMPYLLNKFFGEPNEKVEYNPAEIVTDAVTSGLQNTMKLSVVEDVAVDALTAIDITDMLGLFSKVVIRSERMGDKDFEMLNRQLFNVALAVGMSGSMKVLGKVFSKCKTIISNKFKDSKEAKEFLEEKLGEELADKVMRRIEAAVPDATEAKALTEIDIREKDLDVHDAEITKHADNVEPTSGDAVSDKVPVSKYDAIPQEIRSMFPKRSGFADVR